MALRRKSAKRAALERVVGPLRKQWIAEAGRCQNPFCKNTDHRLCVHEITNGPHREQSLGVRAACLVLCWRCNGDDFEDKNLWPVPRQLALKMLVDTEHFDLEAVNLILCPNGHQRWTIADVARYLDITP